MAEKDEPIVITRHSIGLAFLIVSSSHRLLNALLDEKPKAEIIRELAGELEEFSANSIDCNLDDRSTFGIIHECFVETRNYTVRVDDVNTNLVLEERELVAVN